MFPNVIKHKVTPRKEKPMLSLTEIQFPFPAFQKIFKKESRSVSSKEQKEYYYSEKKRKAWPEIHLLASRYVVYLILSRLLP